MHTFQLEKKKKFMFPFGLVLMIIAFAVITGISALFFNNQFALASGNQLVLKDVSEGYLSGAYKIKSAKDSNLCFDVEGGVELENGIKILAFGSHTNANQKFNFTPIEHNGSYIYTISTIYSDGYVLDITGGLSDENTSLQIYEYNGTVAQKFMIKAVYWGETFKGYVLLTGTTGYQKVLSNSNGYIVQKSFSYNSLDFLNQVWHFEQCFSGNTYSESGYLDSNKHSGAYNAINYDISKRYNGGFMRIVMTGKVWSSLSQ